MSFRGKPSWQGGRRLRLFIVFASPPPSLYGVLSVFICLSSSTGPPRMSPKSQRTPRAHRVPPCRTTGVPPGVDLISHNAPGEVPVTPPTRSSSSGGTWSSVVSGGRIVLSFLFFLFISLLFMCFYFDTFPNFSYYYIYIYITFSYYYICKGHRKLWFSTTCFEGPWILVKGHKKYLINIFHLLLV